MIVFVVCFLLALGASIVALTTRALPGSEKKWVMLGWVASLLGSVGFMLVLFNVYGSGDLFIYHRQGNMVAELIRTDFGRYFPMTLDAFMQRPTELNALLFSPESSTASMVCIASWIFFLLGDSLIGACLVGALLSYTGRLGIYMALRSFFGLKGRYYLALASFATPSAIFWMGGLLKEPVACAGMGWVIWASFALLKRKNIISAFILLPLGLLLTLKIKPYIILPMGAAFGVYIVFERARRANRSFLSLLNPLNITLAILLAAGTALLVGVVAPKMAIENLAEETARLQSYGGRTNGASNFQIGDSSATTASGQAVFAPIALISSLFRPFFFEVHNAPAAMSGLEMIFAQLAFAYLLFTHGIKHLGQLFFRIPTFAFLLVFVTIFGVGVGLGTTNMGTLSRYRVPMMPLYFFLLFMLVKTPKRAAESMT